ncbi:MAG: SAM-dependent methyltransferase [Planctomyces sp.]|nr:SAM-dependent methyltransferase [Planctomyces sp.]
MTNPQHRFSHRVEHYRKFRPTYPAGVIDLLRETIGLQPRWIIADLGSGTGISSRLFLDQGHVVYGIEPNAPMRAAAEEELGENPRFHSVGGTAEATTLPDHSVDLVIAAQAFHWFDIPATRREVIRILKPGGWAVLLWNQRPTTGSPFLVEYEQLLQTHGKDYATIRDSHRDAGRLREFFGEAGYLERSVPNPQQLTYDELRGRLMSASYVPLEAQPGHANMILDLKFLFARHAQGGVVNMDLTTELFCGQLLSPAV